MLASGDYSGHAPAVPETTPCEAACDLALANGFADAADDENVIVHIPPVDGTLCRVRRLHRGHDRRGPALDLRRRHRAGHLARRARTRSPANQDGVAYTFGMLALNPTECKALQVAGTGVVNSESNIQANSTDPNAIGDPYRLQPDRRRHAQPGRHGRVPEREPDPGPGQRNHDLQQGAELVRAAGSAPESAGPAAADLRWFRRPTRAGRRRSSPSAIPTEVPSNCPGTLSTRKPFEETQTAALRDR